MLSRLRALGRALRLPLPPPPPPHPLGARSGGLAPCPPTPNCVCSTCPGAYHAMDPIPGAGDRERTWRALRRLLESDPRFVVVRDDGRYLHAEFTTPLWRFVDDVEFLWDQAQGVVHFRSASRLGRWDLGANRRRMDRIRRQMSATRPPR